MKLDKKQRAAVAEEITAILTARAQRQHVASPLVGYKQLGEKLLTIRYVHSDPSHRKILADALGAVTKKEFRAGRGMLTALVVNMETREPGEPGFGDTMAHLGLIPADYTEEQSRECWKSQVKAVLAAHEKTEATD